MRTVSWRAHVLFLYTVAVISADPSSARDAGDGYLQAERARMQSAATTKIPEVKDLTRLERIGEYGWPSPPS